MRRLDEAASSFEAYGVALPIPIIENVSIQTATSEESTESDAIVITLNLYMQGVNNEILSQNRNRCLSPC